MREEWVSPLPDPDTEFPEGIPDRPPPRVDRDRAADFRGGGRNAWPLSPGDIGGGTRGLAFVLAYVPAYGLAYWLNDQDHEGLTWLLALLIVIACHWLIEGSRKH